MPAIWIIFFSALIVFVHNIVRNYQCTFFNRCYRHVLEWYICMWMRTAINVKQPVNEWTVQWNIYMYFICRNVAIIPIIRCGRCRVTESKKNQFPVTIPFYSCSPYQSNKIDEILHLLPQYSLNHITHLNLTQLIF